MAFKRGSGRVRRFAKVRTPRGEMNANEQRYAAWLQTKKDHGGVVDFQFEKITLKLAPRTTLTVDFLVVTRDLTLELHEVKGGKKNGKYHVEEDAWLKLKLAAAQFPWLKILVVWWHKDHGWKEQEVGAHGADDTDAQTTLDTED